MQIAVLWKRKNRLLLKNGIFDNFKNMLWGIHGNKYNYNILKKALNKQNTGGKKGVEGEKELVL